MEIHADVIIIRYELLKVLAIGVYYLSYGPKTGTVKELEYNFASHHFCHHSHLPHHRSILEEWTLHLHKWTRSPSLFSESGLKYSKNEF